MSGECDLAPAADVNREGGVDCRLLSAGTNIVKRAEGVVSGTST